jgi:hypothetical protein
VTGIKPDPDNGVVEIAFFTPEPPGKLGVLCDPFNDALNVTSRDITGWTDANGKRNDANQISVRSGEAVKDAGQISTRTFSC